MNPPPIFFDSMDQAQLQRARELLPWAATGQLDASEQALLDHCLENLMSRHPEFAATWQAEAAAEQAWLRSAGRILQLAKLGNEQANISAQAQGLNQLMQRIAHGQNSLAPSLPDTTNLIALSADNTPASDQIGIRNSPDSRTSPKPHHLLEHISAWLAANLGARPEKLGWALAAVILVQAGVIGALLHREGAVQEPLAGQQSAPSPAQVLLTVAFKPQATEQALRELLSAAGAQIVSGPSALGLYIVAVPAERADPIMAQLRAATSLVESVQR